MLEILTMLFIGFSVGLTGALVPGPMLFATIETSLTKGWTSGPRVVSGHALIELLVFVLIVTGFSTLASQGVILWISVIGGAVLVIFGVMTIKEGKTATLSGGNSVFKSPFAAGVITSISHPYFWLWWLTAGAGLILMGLEVSLFAASIFLIGHLMADLSWYTVVSTAMSRGKTLMSEVMYQRVLMGCGVFLMLFGVWFMTSQVEMDKLFGFN
ncbi:MAG: LysE family transporter [Methanosarcinales archaeon]|nr:LysE family transporter [Methanosarcinales archaeon]